MQLNSPASNESQGLVSVISRIAGGVLGVVLSRVFGLMLLIPGIGGLILFGLLAKFGPRRSKPFVPAMSVLGGALAWLFAGTLLSDPTNILSHVEVGIFVLLSIWLMSRPSLAAVITLAVLDGLGVLALLLTVLSMPVDVKNPMWAAPVLGILLRSFVLFLLFTGWRHFRQLEQNPEQAPPATAGDPLPGSPAPAMAPAVAMAAAPSNPWWVKCGECGLQHRKTLTGFCPKCGAGVGPAEG